jgi:hypothetical protein
MRYRISVVIKRSGTLSCFDESSRYPMYLSLRACVATSQKQDAAAIGAIEGDCLPFKPSPTYLEYLVSFKVIIFDLRVLFNKKQPEGCFGFYNTDFL